MAVEGAMFSPETNLLMQKANRVLESSSRHREAVLASTRAANGGSAVPPPQTQPGADSFHTPPRARGAGGLAAGGDGGSDAGPHSTDDILAKARAMVASVDGGGGPGYTSRFRHSGVARLDPSANPAAAVMSPDTMALMQKAERVLAASAAHRSNIRGGAGVTTGLDSRVGNPFDQPGTPLHLRTPQQPQFGSSRGAGGAVSPIAPGTVTPGSRSAGGAGGSGSGSGAHSSYTNSRASGGGGGGEGQNGSFGDGGVGGLGDIQTALADAQSRLAALESSVDQSRANGSAVGPSASGDVSVGAQSEASIAANNDVLTEIRDAQKELSGRLESVENRLASALEAISGQMAQVLEKLTSLEQAQTAGAESAAAPVNETV